MKLKKILGCIAAAGMAVGGLILAGKSEFGKGFGEKSEPEYDPCEDAADAAPEEEEEEEAKAEEPEAEE